MEISINNGDGMDNMEVQRLLEQMEKEKKSLFSLSQNKVMENNYLLNDSDLDDEFDAIN